MSIDCMLHPRRSRLCLAWVVGLVVGLVVGIAPAYAARPSSPTAVVPAPAASAPTLSVYPKYIAVKKVGGTTKDAGPKSNVPPTQIITKSNQTVKLEGGIFNASHTAQKAVVHFGIDCWALPNEVMQNGPSITVTVPGDPASIPGLAVMARVTGTFAIPSTCNHISGNTTDGNFIFEVTSPGTTGSPGAEDEAFAFGSSIPGAGFPPIGTVGSVVLWRAVDSTELSAIKAAGKRYALGPGDEGKYFYPTKAQAQALAQKYESMGYGSYSVTSAEVEDSVFDAGAVDSIAPAAEGNAWYFLTSAVEAIGEVTIFE